MTYDLLQSLAGIARQNGIRSHKELAERAGMDRAQVTRYLSGKIQPSLENFVRLAKAAGAKVIVE